MINDIFSEPLDVLIEVARDPNTAPEVLDKLSHSVEMIVRYFVLINPSTPKATIDALNKQILELNSVECALYIEFSYQDSLREVELYNSIKDIIRFYGGTFEEYNIVDDPDDEGSSFARITVEFNVACIFFEAQPGVRLELELRDWVADDIEAKIDAMGYFIEGSDWY